MSASESSSRPYAASARTSAVTPVVTSESGDDRQVGGQIIPRDPPLPHGLGEQQRGPGLGLPPGRRLRERLRGEAVGEGRQGMPRRGGGLVVLVPARRDVRRRVPRGAPRDVPPKARPWVAPGPEAFRDRE
ncbi:hypothetical protein THAOC_05672, partial [Thalassiosira oceanica]